MTEIEALHDKLIRSYLFTLNKDGPTERDLNAKEVDLILLALTLLCDLPEEPGPRYTAGEYSRRNHQAMIDDLMAEQEAGRLRQEKAKGL